MSPTEFDIDCEQENPHSGFDRSSEIQCQTFCSGVRVKRARFFSSAPF